MRHPSSCMGVMAIASLAIVFWVFANRPPSTAAFAPSPSKNFLPLIARSQSGPTLGGCPLFPSNNIWNARIDALPVDSKSSAYINFIGASAGLHPDFGANWNGGPFGIPFDRVPGSQPSVPITFDYNDESDPGPYPIPPNASIEGGAGSTGDRHVLVLQTGSCLLYEMYYAFPVNGGAAWTAGSGAQYNLNSNALRPAGWTSADAAGLPMLPGLVRYDEVVAGAINHAIRFTVNGTNNTYIWPARHRTSAPYNVNAPPMGQRLRLKATFNIATFDPTVQVILTAFKRYGIIVADNGSNWYISGAPDARWNDDILVTQFRRVHGSDFEAVDESSLMVDPNSGQVR